MARPAASGPARHWRSFITVMAWISGCGIALLMIPTVLDVTYRKLLGPSIPGMLEYSEIGLVVVVFLAMAATLHRRAHIYTPILTSRLRPQLASTLRIVGYLAVWVTLAVMVYGSAGVALESVITREYRFGITQVPIWPAKLIVPFGLLLLLIELTVQIWEAVFGRQSNVGSHAG